MEQKLRAVFEGGRPGVPVAQLCRELEISRDSYYRLLKRFEAEGLAGLAARSRRPHVSPQLIPAALEDEIVRLRKELPLDNGAQTIAYHLARSGWPVPAVRTIHRALERRGLIVPEPHKRPKTVPWKRFEWPAPNAAWQIDATRWVLADGVEVWVMDVLDDHSRVVVAARVWPGPSGDAAWDALSTGAARWGLPARMMSDNGSCFTGRFQGGHTVEFERTLARLGITQLLSSPAHPQTCGKLERFHQTLKKWLRTQPLATTLAELQAQLDQFLVFYNHQRPHRALGGATPAERFTATPPAVPGDPIAPAPIARLQRVSTTGCIGWNHNHLIHVGAEHRGSQLLVIARGDDLAIYGPTGEIRRLTLDRNRRYQPSGRPPGRPPRHP